MALDIKYCYSRPELKSQGRITLMNYLEGRYNILRSDSQIPPGTTYTGEFTADMKNPEAVIESIWEKYQAEGVAAKRSLNESAPRPPSSSQDIEPPAEETLVPTEEPTEVKTPDETPDEDTKPKRKYTKKVTVDIPVSTPAVDLQPVLDSIQSINENIGILAEGIQGGLQEGGLERTRIQAAIDLQGMLTKDIILPTLSWLIKLAAHAVGEARGDYGWKEGVEKLDDVVTTLTDMIDNSLELLTAVDDEARNNEAIEDLYIEGGDEEEGGEDEDEEQSKRVTKKPPGKSGVPPKRIQGLSSADTIYTMTVDGKELNFSMADLTDKNRFPNSLLNKMGTVLGIQLTPVERVQKLTLICDSFTD